MGSEYKDNEKDNHNEYARKFALRLSSLRNNSGSSAREMSLALDHNHAYINSIENAKAFPTMDVFFSMCDYLNVSPAEFFIEFNQDKTSDKRTQIHEYIALLSDAQVDFIHALLSDITRRN